MQMSDAGAVSPYDAGRDAPRPAADARPDGGGQAHDAAVADGPAAPDAALPPSPANHGWVGGACAVADECAFANAMCLRDGFPNGACTLPCTGVCPDRTQ